MNTVSVIGLPCEMNDSHRADRLAFGLLLADDDQARLAMPERPCPVTAGQPTC